MTKYNKNLFVFQIKNHKKTASVLRRLLFFLTTYFYTFDAQTILS